MYYSKENIITKLQKLYSSARNLRASNKSPAPFLKKPLCTGDLSPVLKILIERPVSSMDKQNWRFSLSKKKLGKNITFNKNLRWLRTRMYFLHDTDLNFLFFFKMDRIPTKIKWKIAACPFHIVLQVLKVHLIKKCKAEPPDLLFLVVFISFYVSRHPSFFTNF